MDGMDSFIYSIILVPALMDLLPKSGIEATTANVGFYGALLFALFMMGWGIALIWGPIADRFGRVQTLSLTILCFSVFTLLSAFANNVWTLAILRLLAGIGIGGEWSMGASLVSEDWPEERRTMGVSLMHTGFYFGLFLAALANYFVGSHFGWRYMFVVGGTPALLVAVIWRGVHEPIRWEKKLEHLGGTWRMHDAFLALFTPEFRRRTVLNSLYLLASIVGLWAGSVYIPTAVTYLAQNGGRTGSEAAQMASYATALLGFGTILGAPIVPLIADRIGRRLALGLFFGLMAISIWIAFGHVLYMGTGALEWFMVCAFVLGIGGANVVVYSFWLPEQYPTECRASAFAFTTNIGRFVGAGFTFLVGAGIRYYQTLGIPVAMTAIVFVVGILLLPFGEETKGKPLPS
jgi:MFS family permease